MLEYQESVQPTDISRWSWQPGSVSATSQGGLQFTAQLRPPKKDSWGSVKPPSYATWSCRETPWREAGPRRGRRARTEAKVDAKVDVRWRKRTETPSTRCPSRAVQPSPQLRTPSPDAFVVSKAPSPAPMDVIQSPSRRLGPSQWSWLLTHQGDRDCMASLMSDASCVLAERYSEPSAVLQDPADEHSARHAETMEGLRVASMVMGEKARGPVTLGIRVKAVQRLAVASALRQLVHLPAGRQQEEEMEGDSAAISPSSPRSLYSMETDNLPPPSESSEEEEEAPPAQDSLAAMLSSAAKSCKLSSKIQQTRFREVLANTTLGKMVKAHPEKAAKFGLAVVPKWSHNKPWPPPPVVAHFSSQPSAWALRLLQKTEDRKKKEEEGARRRMSTNMERRFTRKMSRAQTDGEERMSPDNVIISDLASAVTSQRKRTPRTSMFKGQGASMRRYSRPEEEERLQDILDHAVTIIKMNIPEKDAIINCFLKHSLSTTPSHLSSQALLRGFAEMEIQPKTFREKQTMKEVQELVIKKYRKEDKNFEVDGIKNPLKHKRGGWLFEEFLAMTATYKQIAREEQEEVDQALASQNSCELAVIREFRKVYNESRTQEQMIVKDVLAILSKVGIRNPSDKELALLLNLQLGANMELSRFRRITFADFIPAMLKIQGMLAQVAGDPEEES
mmetsp:Transcript_12816/g.22188  ORF Transcript_12816/g.22188 Transcript_12816/m.22188 type:complete len:676 (+) Transcript_12816:35-2062(+)